MTPALTIVAVALIAVAMFVQAHRDGRAAADDAPLGVFEVDR